MQSLLIVIPLIVVFLGAGVAIWLGMKAGKGSASSEGDTAWNDTVSPGVEATRPTDDAEPRP